MDSKFLFTGWVLQAFAYLLLLTRQNPPFSRWYIFGVAVVVYIIAPLAIPFNGGHNPETGEYVCGLVGFARTMTFWLFGNIINLCLCIFSFFFKPALDKKSLTPDAVSKS